MRLRINIRKVIRLLAVSILLVVLFQTERDEDKKNVIYTLSDKEVLGNGLEWELVQTHLPIFGCLFYANGQNSSFEKMVADLSPLYQYLVNQEVMARGKEQTKDMVLGEDMNRLLLEENADAALKKQADTYKEQQSEKSDDTGGEAVNGIEKEDMTENVDRLVNNNGQTDYATHNEESAIQEAGKDVYDAASVFFTPSDFEPRKEKQREYNWDEYTDLTAVRKEFFAIDATTQIADERINPKGLLEKDITIGEPNGGPQILIYHTHSQEAFVDSIPGNGDTSIVGAGEYLKNLLQDTYGFEVLHHTGEYDVESRDYAYSNALPNIEAVLAEYPSIEVVIDLHRDAVAEGTKLVSEQNGKQAAQVMFFNGLSHTKKQGDIAYLENPYIDDNLAFSFQMQVLCNEYYPGLTRRIYLKGYRYNMHLCSKSLLIELGAQTNTCEEAKNTLDIVAHVLSMCLKGEE